jgi:hypothetical protein
MTKGELFQKFGPKLLDAIMQFNISENNILRAKLGLPEKTEEQIIDTIAEKLEKISDYQWMKDRL